MGLIHNDFEYRVGQLLAVSKKKSLKDHVKDVILFTVTDGAQLTKQINKNSQKKTQDKLVRASGSRLASVWLWNFLRWYVLKSKIFGQDSTYS